MEFPTTSSSPTHHNHLKPPLPPKKNNNNKYRRPKLNGRGLRVRLPALCASRIFQLTRELGHRTHGQTVDWLLHHVDPSVFPSSSTNNNAGVAAAVKEEEAELEMFSNMSFMSLLMQVEENHNRPEVKTEVDDFSM